MPEIILFDEPVIRLQLLPFTYTRPVAGIRCGILTIAEKWKLWLKTHVSYTTEPYLRHKFAGSHSADSLHINGALCPDENLLKRVLSIRSGEILISEQGEILAARTTEVTPDLTELIANFPASVIHREPFTMIRNVWDIFLYNGAQIISDFGKITQGKTAQPITDPFTSCYHPEKIFIEEGAVVKASVLNAENGPIFIGRNALVQEGSMVQGPFSLGENSVLAQGTKIRPNTTVGPFCKVGGEVSNSVVFGYSNKGHDGYLGNSVLGEWCNLGANTNNSNLKNDHSEVKLFSYASNTLKNTGLTFCGLMMGDYSKAGISTMFNTGTVVGISVNVFGAGFQPKHIPSFSWGGGMEGFTEYRFQKALAVAKDTVNRRNVHFGMHEEDILARIFELTAAHREKQ
ncbi:hypothetical protein DYBT9275_00273 [Dyadobacter sp. CECT 9275]|uniref:Glucose-1-phosphate thymidylyltransferase n=1 Tax=Dyadobacter helix TaxID=2822344 RepID=A0A916NAQ0_9BACT|nr:putative sugar nucleotidyl transferase [Dyadobacter sp. CECT 9275]CAG4989349.1 hypothetical protein DYBT9275_00273 [Dyadobacter sp. CECT 9275]